MRLAFALILFLHALVHLLGGARALGWIASGAGQPPPGVAGAWLGVGGALLVAAVAVFVPLARWWEVVAAAAIASQVMILAEWADARFGSLVNALALLAAAWGVATEGRSSPRDRYRRSVAALPPTPPDPPSVTEADLVHLPPPVRAWLRRAGVVGQPRVHGFAARLTGRVRAGPDEPWMPFVAEQRSVLDPPTRVFRLEATRRGVPIHALHRFVNGAATMEVRLLGAIPVADAAGPEMTAADTHTLLHDLCVFAPGALIDPRLGWEALDGQHVLVRMAVGPNRVAAVLRFDEAGDLVDYVAEARGRASPDGATFTPTRWTTPLSQPRTFGGLRLPSRLEARWHPERGAFTYVEAEVVSVEPNPVE